MIHLQITQADRVDDLGKIKLVFDFLFIRSVWYDN